MAPELFNKAEVFSAKQLSCKEINGHTRRLRFTTYKSEKSGDQTELINPYQSGGRIFVVKPQYLYFS